MAKNCLLGITLLLAFVCKGQLILTKQAYEPQNGDLYQAIMYTPNDSTTPPVSTGANQLWDFSSSIVLSNQTFTVPYASSSSQGTTLSSLHPMNRVKYYLSNASPLQFELVQEQAQGPISTYYINYSDSKILYQWPVAFGNSYTDSYSSTATIPAAGTSSIMGAYSFSASGTGTLILPGGMVVPNVLQIMTVDVVNYTMTGSPIGSYTVQSCEFFHATQKFPLCSLTFEQNYYDQFFVNKLTEVGFKDEQQAVFDGIYPNPVRDFLNVEVNNPGGGAVGIELYDVQGRLVRKVQPDRSPIIQVKIPVHDLTKGIYTLITSTGPERRVQKLAVD